MRAFFSRVLAVVLAAWLVTGCTTLPDAPEQEAVSPPVVEAPPPEEAQPLISVQDAVAQREEELLRKQLEEHIRFQRLLEDLARYPSLNAEETQRTQRELNSRIPAPGQSSGNGDRIRLAYLLSLHPSGVNDQRAIAMLEAVMKNENALTRLQHLASVLRRQIQEKQRIMQKLETVREKLEALRDIDRLFLEDRIHDSRTLPSPTPPRP